MVKRITFDIWVIIFSGLIAGNVFFVKRLIEKVDNTEIQVYALREEIAGLKVKLNDILLNAVLKQTVYVEK